MPISKKCVVMAALAVLVPFEHSKAGPKRALRLRLQMCLRVLSAIDEKIKQSAAEREENKKFTIKHDDVAKENQPPSAA